MPQISGTTDSSYFQRTEGAFQIRGNHCDDAACEQDTISLRGSITFGKRVIYPDFTIRHPVTGQTYYWEHFGMMDNENYAQAAFQKMQLYNINGIMLSDTLLATYESEEVPLKSNIVENMIQQYFL